MRYLSQFLAMSASIVSVSGFFLYTLNKNLCQSNKDDIYSTYDQNKQTHYIPGMKEKDDIWLDENLADLTRWESKSPIYKIFVPPPSPKYSELA